MFSFIWWLGAILILLGALIPFYSFFSDFSDEKRRDLAYVSVLFIALGTLCGGLGKLLF